MTQIQAQIIELFKTLCADEKRELIKRLTAAPAGPTFYSEMSPEQRSVLQNGIDQADQGNVVDCVEALDRVAQRLNFTRV
jgi:truncated hemoglobin YjbI